MTNLKRGVRHNFVFLLQQLLNGQGYSLKVDGYFGAATEAAVRDFQEKHHLKKDGIVGVKTWTVLNAQASVTLPRFLSEDDFVRAAAELQIEPALIKAVQEVETGGRSGFLTDGRPVILFEGHIFWKELKKRGLDPQDYKDGNGDILYARWTKEHYLGGSAEYGRLEKARSIHEEAALCSASWGMFQIMGFNHKLCGFERVSDFTATQYRSEGEQLLSFAAFVRNSSCLDPLRAKDWRGFARCYNGPGYQANAYHTKLEKAYRKYTS